MRGVYGRYTEQYYYHVRCMYRITIMYAITLGESILSEWQWTKQLSLKYVLILIACADN